LLSRDTTAELSPGPDETTSPTDRDVLAAPSAAVPAIVRRQPAPESFLETLP
jgi:hypothetical protein